MDVLGATRRVIDEMERNFLTEEERVELNGIERHERNGGPIEHFDKDVVPKLDKHSEAVPRIGSCGVSPWCLTPRGLRVSCH